MGAGGASSLPAQGLRLLEHGARAFEVVGGDHDPHAPERGVGKTCPALLEKKVSPHVLRHSAAMRLLSAGVDTSVIALWMGHENTATTQVYIHADLALKERAIARTALQDTTPGRYQPADDILAFLDGL
jgi:integrase